MYEKVLTVILLLSGLLFVGSGITGFATLDASNTLCVDDSDCRYSVCCAVEGQNYGICGQPEECADIFSGDAEVDLQRAASLPERAERNYIALVLGSILLIFIIIIAYVEWHQEKLHPGHHKKKRRKKKRK